MYFHPFKPLASSPSATFLHNITLQQFFLFLLDEQKFNYVCVKESDIRDKLRGEKRAEKMKMPREKLKMLQQAYETRAT